MYVGMLGDVWYDITDATYTNVPRRQVKERKREREREREIQTDRHSRN